MFTSQHCTVRSSIPSSLGVAGGPGGRTTLSDDDDHQTLWDVVTLLSRVDSFLVQRPGAPEPMSFNNFIFWGGSSKVIFPVCTQPPFFKDT